MLGLDDSDESGEEAKAIGSYRSNNNNRFKRRPTEQNRTSQS